MVGVVAVVVVVVDMVGIGVVVSGSDVVALEDIVDVTVIVQYSSYLPLTYNSCKSVILYLVHVVLALHDVDPRYTVNVCMVS